MYRTHSFMQRMPVYGGFAPLVTENVARPDGTSETIVVPSNKKLPDAENYKLENLQRSGVPLQQTRTKILVGESMGNTPAEIARQFEYNNEEIEQKLNED